jgi:hydroxypyruvate isomerase
MPLSRRSLLAGSAAIASASMIATGRASAEEPAVDSKSLGKTKNTKFAVNIEMWFNKTPYLERFQKAADLGFPAVEIWPYKGNDRDPDRLAAAAQKAGVAIAQFTAWGFRPGMNDPKQEDAFVAAIEEACQVAHKLKTNKMCVVAGDNQPGMTKEQMHAQCIKALRRAVPICERERVMMILEPMNGRVDHPGHCLYGSVDALAICDAVNSPMMKINWDLYHMQISEGDLCGRLKDGIRHVGYLQLADHPGRNEPGTGEINYSRVLRQAKELGYDGYVGLELRPKTIDLAAAIAVNRADQW